MLTDYIWTEHRARLQRVRTHDDKSPNHWVFLPGIGLGSEYLKELINILEVKGSFWLLDLPGDGSNLPSNDEVFMHWQEALIEAVSSLPNVILVAHSAGGMFALSVKEIANILKGLVLIGSAPDASWQSGFAEYVRAHPLPELEALQKVYDVTPSNDLLKQMVVASVAYSFMPQSFEAGKKCLSEMSYNYLASQWAAKHFEQDYKAAWIPEIPTLILSGSADRITPLELFKLAPQFQLNQIRMINIEGAGHFPWIENPVQVGHEFLRFSRQL